MVAALKDMAAPLPLLAEPLEPRHRARRCIGWTVRERWNAQGVTTVAERNQADDARGAAAQHIIVRYLVHCVGRKQIAAEAGYSERQIQACLSGRSYAAYTRPVLDTLADLGISPSHGKRGTTKISGAGRLAEIMAAQAALLDRASWLLNADERPAVADLRATIRLLRAGREPVRWPN